jgi:hypothetical protein
MVPAPRQPALRADSAPAWRRWDRGTSAVLHPAIAGPSGGRPKDRGVVLR